MYVELHCHTSYSFLDGASDVEVLVRRASELGMPALAVTDHNSLTAAVKFAAACRDYYILPIFGAELTLSDHSHLTLLAASRMGYANICAILSLAYAQGGRLTPSLPWGELAGWTDGVVCLSGCRRGKVSQLILDRRYDDALLAARGLKDLFGDNLFIELQDDLTPQSGRICRELVMLAKRIGARCVATNNVHYATADGIILHDVKKCIALGITIADIHADRPLNAERRLKSEREMRALFHWHPEAIENTYRIAQLCSGSGIMPADVDVTPHYPTPDGTTPEQHLHDLAYAGARRRHGTITAKGKKRLDEELGLLAELGYSSLVLHAGRIVRWARDQGIMVTGRGSGADSEVCYCLGMTDIDVLARDLPIERWVAPGKKPDIDIDFDARYRDDVFRWVVQDYGADKVALCCTYATYWARGALRDIGKVLQAPPEVLTWFSKHINVFMQADQIKEAFERNAELRQYSSMAGRFTLLFDLCRRISGHPRHLGSHSSGLVIGGIPLSNLNVVTPSARGIVPIVMLDKDDVEEAGAVKLDILSLPILAVVTETERDIQRSNPDFRYEDIPREDLPTYHMLWAGNNMGLFQLGSPAQAALSTQLHPRHFEDLVAAIGLIRPGPIKAKAVQKYCAARNGYARIEYLHPALEPILRRTYGVCCFQEQVSYIIAAMLKISNAEAEVWRKKLTKHDRFGTMHEARADFVGRACAEHSDLSPGIAHRIMDELEGWSGLGFVEGHSASFALTGQKTAYMMRHFPAQYYCAMMSNQPCGFYAPQSLASEARRRGVRLMPVDINTSVSDCTTGENADTILIGLSLIGGIRDQDIESIVDGRERNGPYRSFLDFCVRVSLRRDLLESLILCGAFDYLHEHRRGLLWRMDETLSKALAIRADISSGAQGHLGIQIPGMGHTPVAWDIDDFDEWDKLMWEWRVVSVTTSCHPFAHLRSRLAERGIISCHEAMQCKAGVRVTIAGLNLRPHRPPSKTGGRHLFTTFEDETAYIQAAFYGQAVDDCIAAVLQCPVLIARGRIKRMGWGASIEVERVWPLRMKSPSGKGGTSEINGRIAQAQQTTAPRRGR